MMESESLLEKCPGCGALPIAAKLQKPPTRPEVRLGVRSAGTRSSAASGMPTIDASPGRPQRSEGRHRVMADHLETTVAPLPSKRRCRFSKSSKTAITERSFRRGRR